MLIAVINLYKLLVASSARDDNTDPMHLRVVSSQCNDLSFWTVELLGRVVDDKELFVHCSVACVFILQSCDTCKVPGGRPPGKCGKVREFKSDWKKLGKCCVLPWVM